MNTTSPEQELKEVLGLIGLFNSIDNDESGNETWLAEAISQLLIEAKIDELKRCMLQSMASGELKHKFTRRIEQLEHELSLLGKEE